MKPFARSTLTFALTASAAPVAALFFLGCAAQDAQLSKEMTAGTPVRTPSATSEQPVGGVGPDGRSAPGGPANAPAGPANGPAVPGHAPAGEGVGIGPGPGPLLEATAACQTKGPGDTCSFKLVDKDEKGICQPSERAAGLACLPSKPNALPPL